MPSAPRTTDPSAARPLDAEIQALRPALTGYCYRMLGSGIDAEDAVQETVIRAWRKADGLQERAALKSWLYRIATNVCLDLLQGRSRRAMPMDLSEPQTADALLGAPLTESAWVLPIADASVTATGPGGAGDPAAVAAGRETLRLAFVAALQHLPPRQRAVLVLCDVLRWSARETAALLETSVASVNSALQRARATLDTLDLDSSTVAPRIDDPRERELLERYLDAFEAYDIERLATLLRDDVVFDMPPLPLWLRGPVEVGRFMLGQGAACRGSRTIATRANGCPAFGSYKPAEDGDGWAPWSLTVLEMSDDGITEIHNVLQPFLPPKLFASFGLPARLDRDGVAVDDPPAAQEPTGA
ncbi:MAG: sigma-70 family RNA polymerase sigma factor [Solirubrobacteraceae bacterium]|nr:sigma-70 family RNA polymerase sigma factor [Solirubrobacteraceae bacterium]